MQMPSAESWQGFADQRRHTYRMAGGGVGAWLAAGFLNGLAALIAIVLLPVLIGIVLLGLTLIGVNRLRGMISRAVRSVLPRRDAQGRRNVRVLVRNA